MRQDNIVAIEGRLSIDERETKIIAVKITKLAKESDEVKPLPQNALHLKVEAYLDNPLTQRQLASVFTRFKGRDVVYLHLMGARKIIKVSEEYWVDQSNPYLVPALERVLGEGCIMDRQMFS